MQKVFDFTSKPDPYVADAVVLTCFDHRISDAVAEFLRTRGIRNPDMIVVAGGAKTLASPSSSLERDFILEQIRLSIQLHRPNRVLVISHSDCGTYGGLANFKGDAAAEMEHHRNELCRAVDLISAHFANIPVEPYFVNFSGLWSGS
jgi:carbonic anhydrase